jgi:hypothetical protein
MKRLIAVLSMVILSMVLMSPNANAVTRNVKWIMYNSGKSNTGAIFHLVRNGEFIGQARIVEPGGKRAVMKMVVSVPGDNPFGIKVWQPTNSCVIVKHKIGFIWFTAKKYQASHAGDRWVTKTMGDSGDKFKVIIYKGKRCP